MQQHESVMQQLRELSMHSQERLNQHDALMQRLLQTLEAIRDMLDRGNGH